MQFDERVHLAVIGDGFIRTPFLNGTRDGVPYRATECTPREPQIIHIPAAGRRSGLSEAFPAFRRAFFASTLVQSLSTDQAAQMNQEGAGLTFGFNPNPHRNACRAHLSAGTAIRGEPALVLDTPIEADSPMDFNALHWGTAPTGWLVWATRYWHGVRHLDQPLNRAFIPLHFDMDLNTIYTYGVAGVRATVPIYGGSSAPLVYDPYVGPSSASTSAPLTGGGWAEVFQDALGGWYLGLTGIPAGPLSLKVGITDGVEVYARDIVVSDEFPTKPIIGLPTGIVGSYYQANIPSASPTFQVTGSSLPTGMSLDSMTGVVSGTPTVYGTNFWIEADITEPTGNISSVRFIQTISRPPVELMVLHDEEGNDHSTGEHYSLLYVPYGCCIEFGGWSYHFSRIKSSGEPWPFVKALPYSYLSPDRGTVKELENIWSSE